MISKSVNDWKDSGNDLPAAHVCVSGLQAMPGGQCWHPGMISSFWMQWQPLHIWPAGHSVLRWHWQTRKKKICVVRKSVLKASYKFWRWSIGGADQKINLYWNPLNFIDPKMASFIELSSECSTFQNCIELKSKPTFNANHFMIMHLTFLITLTCIMFTTWVLTDTIDAGRFHWTRWVMSASDFCKVHVNVKD